MLVGGGGGVPICHPVCCFSVLRAVLYSEWKLLLVHQPPNVLNKMHLLVDVLIARVCMV
jgi:hypothetical protein